MLNFSDNSLIIFVLLYCIPIIVIVGQSKKLNGRQTFESKSLLGTLVSLLKQPKLVKDVCRLNSSTYLHNLRST